MPEPGHDPVVDRLRSLSTLGGDVHPLSPHEVRRRGDRMRRRRQGAAVLGSMAVVAVVAGGGVALGAALDGGDAPGPAAPTDATSSAAPSGSATTVPDDFPIDAGWPTGRVERIDPTVEGLTGFTPCGEADLYLEDTSPVDLAASSFRGSGESWDELHDTRDRALATYADVDTADTVLDDVRAAVAQCADSPENAGTGYAVEYDDTGRGDDSVLVTEVYTDGGDPDDPESGAGAPTYTTYHFTRVANAVLVSAFEPQEPGADRDDQVGDLLGSDDDVEAAMEATFGAGPEPTGSVAPGD